MHEGVPAYLAQLLRAQYGEETAERIAQGYAAQRVVTLRANPLKTDAQTVRERLAAQDIETSPVPWYADAMIVRGAREDALTGLDLYERGEIYLQSLSSMIPPLLLGAKPGENVLDMAAAPGGKTTQIAALTGNQAMVTACEMNKIRAERLRYNVQRQGATRVTVMNIDSRNLDDLFSFDRILLDAPCSGSGTVQLGSPRSKGQFSREFLSRTTKQQEALLHKALRLLRPGCEMIYSTCSVLAQENEEIVSRVLRKTGALIVPLELAAFDSVPRLPVSIPGTLCVAPDELHEGFFVAKIRRMK
ncbi:MAG: RsmB/NOP family class I SAM-dependent RNA methyltransferase [Candidatus Ventricola sp.]|nr:RsmB/NOP family class I SAM-dependent RNA methyltransferase [Clostridiales bacterium]MDY4543413.1 RsmB/NOP family class I SAM-dependent RNA methyltransferase [Candidatus Ventricola sp.]